MSSLMHRVASALGLQAADPLRAARAQAARRAARIVELDARVAALEARLRSARTRLAEQRRAAGERRRSTLTAQVLAQLLPARVRHLPLLEHDRTAAAARYARHKEASAAYRAVDADDAGRAAAAARVEIDGISWWVPVSQVDPDRVARNQEQAFPLRAILQTREVALGGAMLDLGANIGRTSIPRVLLGDVRAVYAAEPEPANFACLVQNVIEHGLRGFVMPDQVAIGAARGDVTLRRSPYIGGHRVLHTATRKPVETVQVPMWPVDAWLERLGVDPGSISFVKVDVQGCEVGVLQGAGALLARRQSAWQIEVDPALLRGAGSQPADLFALLAHHFTQFIDVGTGQDGPRVRPTAELGEALAYVGVRANKTDVVLYNAG